MKSQFKKFKRLEILVEWMDKQARWKYLVRKILWLCLIFVFYNFYLRFSGVNAGGRGG